MSTDNLAKSGQHGAQVVAVLDGKVPLLLLLVFDNDLVLPLEVDPQPEGEGVAVAVGKFCAKVSSALANACPLSLVRVMLTAVTQTLSCVRLFCPTVSACAFSRSTGCSSDAPVDGSVDGSVICSE